MSGYLNFFATDLSILISGGLFLCSKGSLLNTYFLFSFIFALNHKK